MIMGSMFIAVLAASGVLALASVAFRLFLMADGRQSVKRGVIMAIYLSSFLAWPMVKILMPMSERANGGVTVVGFGERGMGLIDGFVVYGTMTWVAGMVIAGMLTAISLVRMVLKLRGCRREIVRGRKVFVSGEQGFGPFSIGGAIVLNEADFHKNLSMVIEHEQAHVMFGHSVDMLVAQLVVIVCWFNPAAWFFRSELKRIHEFQADGYVLSRGIDSRDYQLFLLERAMRRQITPLANGLCVKGLKGRVAMMQRAECGEANCSWARYGVVSLVIVVAAGLMTEPQLQFGMKLAEKAGQNGGDVRSDDFPAVYVNGEIVDPEELKDVSPSAIKSITISKDKSQMDVELRDD